MFCGKCGAQITNGYRFCFHCGAQVACVEQATQQKEPAQNNMTKKRPLDRKRRLILSAIVLIAITVISVAVYYFCFTETVYLLTSAESNDTIIRFEYDRNGLLVLEELDRGPTYEVWDEQELVYKYYYGEPDGEVDRVKEYDYDKYSNLCSFSVKMGSNNLEDWEYDYDYKRDGQIDSCEVAYKDAPPTNYRFSYDSNGNIKKVTTQTNGDLAAIYNVDTTSIYEEYEYDNAGRLIRETLSKREGTYTCEYTYDHNGHLKTFGKALGEKTQFSYDDAGNLSSAVTYDSNGSVLRIREYRYDRNGNLEEYCDDPIESEKTKYTFEYDEHGNVIAMEKNGAERVEYTYKAIRVSKSQADKIRSYNKYFWNSSCLPGFLFSSFYHHLIPTPVPDPFAATLAGY